MTKPMLFNTDMVRAIQAERKTVTRRVMKPQPEFSILADRKGRMPLSYWVDNERWVKPPYQPGDILYVRETWAAWSPTYGTVPQIIYKADGYSQSHKMKWRPSIHMPREAARLFLWVTDVRVEKLRPMGLDDFEAEGLSTVSGLFDTTARFADIWDSTIKPADRALYGWEANPWCWVIAFERCEKPKGD